MNKDNKNLEINPIQLQILIEIAIQSIFFRDYALKENQPEIADKYEKIREIIMEILKQKREQNIEPEIDNSFFNLMYKLEMTTDEVRRIQEEYKI